MTVLKKAIAKQITVCVFVALAAVIMILNAVTAVLSLGDKRAALGWLPYTALSISGSSMEPEYSEGDLVIIKETDYAGLAIGDDVTYITTDGFVTHRIVGKNAIGYVTKGLASDADDIDTMVPEAYCGRVVAALPFMGHVLNFMTEAYIVILLCALAALAALVLIPLSKRLRARGESPRAPAFSVSLSVLLCVFSVLLSLPFVTQAKYVGEVNRFDPAVAQPVYLSSNYLSKEGNTYSIQGWNGRQYELVLDIKNFDNSLLYNPTGTDVTYWLGYKIRSDDGNSVGYTVSISPSTAGLQEETSGVTIPPNWSNNITSAGAYKLRGGDISTQSFSIKITPSSGEALPEETRIHFELYAATQRGENYIIDLSGSFKFRVAEQLSFIGRTEIEDSSTMTTLSIETNLVNDNLKERIVLVSWDPSKLYINEFESTVFNIITKTPGDLDKVGGNLYMRLQAYTKVELEFFKKQAGEITEGDITVTLVDSIPGS